MTDHLSPIMTAVIGGKHAETNESSVHLLVIPDCTGIILDAGGPRPPSSVGVWTSAINGIF